MVPRILIVLLVVLLGLAFQAIHWPPPPKLCGSLGGPPVTSPRIKLRDGRYLLAFDKAGYGESDPNPKRNVKSEALDIEELADQLELGQKVYVLGVSMGGYSIWGCLQYIIPNRLAGAVLIVPIINYWWPSFPADLSRQAFKRLIMPEQRTLWIAHNIPSLLYLSTTQKWLPSSVAAMKHPEIFSKHDMEVLQKMMTMPVKIFFLAGKIKFVPIYSEFCDRLSIPVIPDTANRISP